ncbi:DUF4382 domain-containing protein [Flavobacterium cellulosilyticum]|uniref:DUF4382 domain-containing protein n=1 Tax=Flavobacterium cellulosilyticum TaxID=2541731 RepID=A0A4V2YZT4_9FLAO|nr:DUF4382 domain-containing protein [Flavobacterium cellulosilyticum]TDD98437.1 DUF4382 domain-containing protein [Flavobacterium cellulosilyticum]
MKKIKLILSIFMVGLIMNSCSSNDSANSTYPVAIKMTDAPGPYSAVFVDLQGVEVTGSGGATVALNVKKGIYNLLDLTNGVSTIIATDTLEMATVEQIRLILGSNNSVIVNNMSYPLSTPSADQTGLKLQVHETLQQGILYSILLDFDANKSIIQLGNGGYKLKPVIRTIQTAISGSIKGKISPVGLAVVSVVNVVNPTLSFSTNVNAEGGFTVMGVTPGTYEVTITPVSPLLPVVKTNIVVSAGITTDIGTTIL